MTIPLADGTPSGVLDVTTPLLRVHPRGRGRTGRSPTVLAAHELEEGQNYFILPTTAYGLYRYHIHDVVRVTGFYNQTPLIEFLSKGAHFANITGEKLSEYHVTQAMDDVLRELDLTLTAYSLAPCWDDEQPYYGLFVERGDLRRSRAGPAAGRGCWSGAWQKSTSNTPASARACAWGRSAWSCCRQAPGTSGTASAWPRTGGTLEQYKHPCLIPDPKFRESMPVEQEVAADPAACILPG